MHPDAPYFIILLCLTPDYFIRQRKSAATLSKESANPSSQPIAKPIHPVNPLPSQSILSTHCQANPSCQPIAKPIHPVNPLPSQSILSTHCQANPSSQPIAKPIHPLNPLPSQSILSTHCQANPSLSTHCQANPSSQSSGRHHTLESGINARRFYS